MGKGFNNYMCKKFFHPASRDNLKRVWMAEQQADSYKKKQDELRLQYEKEQDLYTNKSIMSKESKEKLSVNFLYEPPPGTKKEREREDDEPEYKFEWQRRFNAPRESYCKGDQEIRDQPFGIQVRNVRCIKCHKWGHINTDKECPMYHQSGSGSGSGPSLDPMELIRQMRDDGLAMKKGAAGILELYPALSGNQQLLSSSSEDEDHMNESEVKFLKGLSTKQKMKLLRKLEKLEKKKQKKKHKKEKGKTKKIKKSKKHSRGKSDSESDSDSEDSDSDNDKLKKNSEKSMEKGTSKKGKKEGTAKKEKEWTEVNNEVGRQDDNDIFHILGRKVDFEGPPLKTDLGGCGPRLPSEANCGAHYTERIARGSLRKESEKYQGKSKSPQRQCRSPSPIRDSKHRSERNGHFSRVKERSNRPSSKEGRHHSRSRSRSRDHGSARKRSRYSDSPKKQLNHK